MSHTIKEKQNLILRAKRIQGQVEALVSCPGDFVNTDSLLRVGVSPTKWSG